MGRVGRKFKAAMGRVGKGIKTGWHKFVKFVKGASDTYDRAKQYVSDHQADIDKAKDMLGSMEVSTVVKLLMLLKKVNEPIRKELIMLINREIRLVR